MKNVSIRFLFLLVSLIILGTTSCMRKTTVTTFKTDTVFVKSFDTTTVYLESKSDPVIDTVFLEIEKDCPDMPKTKIEAYKSKVKKATTLENKVGAFRAYSKKLKIGLLIKFKGDSGIVYWTSDIKTVNNSTEIKTTKERTIFRQLLNTFPYYAFFVVFFIVWLVFRFKK